MALPWARNEKIQAIPKTWKWPLTNSKKGTIETYVSELQEIEFFQDLSNSPYWLQVKNATSLTHWFQVCDTQWTRLDFRIAE